MFLKLFQNSKIKFCSGKKKKGFSLIMVQNTAQTRIYLNSTEDNKVFSYSLPFSHLWGYQVEKVWDDIRNTRKIYSKQLFATYSFLKIMFTKLENPNSNLKRPFLLLMWIENVTVIYLLHLHNQSISSFYRFCLYHLYPVYSTHFISTENAWVQFLIISFL